MAYLIISVKFGEYSWQLKLTKVILAAKKKEIQDFHFFAWKNANANWIKHTSYLNWRNEWMLIFRFLILVALAFNSYSIWLHK